MLTEIRRLAAVGQIAFKKHTLLRMHQRSIRAEEIRQALCRGEIVSEYPADRPLPSFLVLGYTKTARPLHCVVSIDVSLPMLWVITVYEPDRRLWNAGLRTRNK